MKKILSMVTVISLILILSSISGFKAQAISAEDSCLTSALSVDKTTVEAGRELKFTLDYQSTDEVCTPEQLAEVSFTIDFSSLTGNYGSVDASYDNSVLDVEIDSTGVATIKFKDWDEIHNTLEGFEGSVVFTVLVSSEVVGDITIENDITPDISVEVLPPSVDDHNTSKWADESYAMVGDVLNYKVRINTDKNNVTNFVGTDNPASGLKYVDDSLYVTNLETGAEVDPSYYTASSSDGQLVIENTDPFSDAYVLHYQMLVTATSSNYTNSFQAIYDGAVENGGWTVDYDVAGDSDVSFTNGLIDIYKTDEDGNPLSGAEFDIVNSAGVVVDHLVTDPTGHAVSDQLALGDYTVIETKAPEQYKLDPTSYEVSIVDNGMAENVTNLTIVNQKIDEPEITNPDVVETGNIKIIKLSDSGEQLSGAEFDIYNSDEDLVTHVVTDAKGVATVNDLPLGDYSIVETKAPDGYQLAADDRQVTIAEADQTVEVEIVNKPIEETVVKDQGKDDKENSNQSDQSESQVEEVVHSAKQEPKLALTGSEIMLYITSALLVLALLFYLKIKNINK